MQKEQAFSAPLVLLFFTDVLHIFSNYTFALNVGIQSSDSAISVSKDCSRKCESEYCSLPPLLRYGKYCWLLYSGCPGERPCDGLDACCMKHDVCIQYKNKMGSRAGDRAKHEDLLQAQAHIYKHMLSHINSMSLKCAVELGIPDIIHNHQKPMTHSELVLLSTLRYAPLLSLISISAATLV